jgi:hypothetical protein
MDELKSILQRLEDLTLNHAKEIRSLNKEFMEKSKNLEKTIELRNMLLYKKNLLNVLPRSKVSISDQRTRDARRREKSSGIIPPPQILGRDAPRK